MSKPKRPGVIRANVVLVRHAGQSGRMMIMMLRLGFRRERYRTLSHRYLPGRGGDEPASNFRDSAAAPFCSHSKIINASLANYDTAGFKLGQLLEQGAAEAMATIRHGIISSGSNRLKQVIARKIRAHKRLRGECVTATRGS
jgi:hypothetical protein